MNRRTLLVTSATALGALFVKAKDSEAKESTKIRLPDLKNPCEHLTSIENVEKAQDVLKELAGFTSQETADTYKAVAKRLPKAREYKQEFIKRTLARRHLTGHNLLNSSIVEVWCAIAVTFFSAGSIDGFLVLDIEIPRQDIIGRDIAKQETGHMRLGGMVPCDYETLLPRTYYVDREFRGFQNNSWFTTLFCPHFFRGSDGESLVWLTQNTIHFRNKITKLANQPSYRSSWCTFTILTEELPS